MQEAQEEARLTLLRLELVALSYPSPGISAEFFFVSILALSHCLKKPIWYQVLQ